MMRALSELGHDIGLLTAEFSAPQAIDGLPLGYHGRFNGTQPHPNGDGPLTLSRFQERFRSYWGIDPNRIRLVGQAAKEFEAHAVIVVGLGVLPYLGEVKNAARIWYAADEWVWHHLSQFRLWKRGTWINFKQSLVKGMYERAYAFLLDRVWLVSKGDCRAMRLVTGIRHLDLLPNGVDGDYYRPMEVPAKENSCVFWGRLDFGPNIQALEWFCKKVWPQVKKSVPGAIFTIYGFQPTQVVKDLLTDGISLVPNLPDLRSEICKHQVVVLPFVSGGGIKNKLLEAGALGKAVVCTPRTCSGLETSEPIPVVLAKGPTHWLHAILDLWRQGDKRAQLEAQFRQWVLRHHSWTRTAQLAEAGLLESIGMTETILKHGEAIEIGSGIVPPSCKPKELKRWRARRHEQTDFHGPGNFSRHHRAFCYFSDCRCSRLLFLRCVAPPLPVEVGIAWQYLRRRYHYLVVLRGHRHFDRHCLPTLWIAFRQIG
jgi:glycosyltransferase involved in cell wall biosynthesis